MASAIDATKPVAGNPTTESVRANFAAAKSEIEVLQQTAGVGPQGPIGPTGPSGTLTVGTVTTGPAGGSATVTNSGTTQAAVLNFTFPRGDSGTGGSGITETQAKDAVAAGNIKFLESPETTAPAFPTTPNLAGVPVVGDGWTPATGGTATQAYTQTNGAQNPLAYPASIANGTTYQIVFSLTTTAGSTSYSSHAISIYLRTGPTVTSGQQPVFEGFAGGTLTVTATGNFTHVVVVPYSSEWRGAFTMTRVVAFTGAQNSISLRVKDWDVRARTTAIYIGQGGTGRLASNAPNIGVGARALLQATTGSENIAIGTDVLTRPTSSNNIAIGAQAMRFALGASGNIAMGEAAMLYHISGSNNIAMGYYAMSYNANGYDNIALGRYAMYWTDPRTATQANSNVAIGAWVGFYGNYNIGIGFQALSYASGPPGLMKGNRVVGIGAYAGSYITGNSSLYAADDSVFLGANTKAHADAETNQTVIGYNATGHGSNTITLGDASITALHCQVQTISALSDTRVKENIEPANLERCFAAVKNLPVYRWAWQAIAGTHKDKHVTGFLADDVSKIWPKAVTKEDAYLPVLNPDGTPQMTTAPAPTAPSPADDGPDAPWKKEPKTPPPLVEKTQEFKDLQYVCLTEILPTLWGAVQYLIQKVEQLSVQPGSQTT